jgi:SAM-dependent methyltransferase
MSKTIEDIQYYFIKTIYGDHNSSNNVKKAIKRVLNDMPENGIGLNIGAGRTSIDPRVKNLEISDGENIDYVGKAESIPFSENSLDLIICQEVLEHTEDFKAALHEMYRVLKPGGQLYLQTPFIIGYHPCPNDYWRFTNEGINSIVLEANFKIIDNGESVGVATGFYRIGVEFLSILFSLIVPLLYKPLKAIFAFLFYPIKWLDSILSFSRESHRISGGFYIICKKV